MDTTTPDFVHAGSLEELKAKGRLVVHGRHRPVLLVYEDGDVFALDNRCPHMGFPLERGSVEDGILTCHWHHARFELASGCTFDLWADDVPTCPVEIRAGDEIWVKPVFGYADPIGHWRQRLEDGLAHNLNLVIAKAVEGQLAAGQSLSDVVRQVALFGTRNRDGWNTGLTILTSLSQLLPFLSEEELHLALFSWGAARGGRLRRCSSETRARAVGESARSYHPKALATALDIGAASGCGRTHRADCHYGRCFAGCTGRPPLCRGDGPRLCRRRTLARFHQQGFRMS
jgi:nitrite reductase/ring-hydroxylating ferredoxin subunit